MAYIKNKSDLEKLECFGFKDEGDFYRKAVFRGFEADAYLVVDKATRNVSILGNCFIDDLVELVEAGLIKRED